MQGEVWRISQHPGLEGKGGLYVSGRWHNVGRPILYTAEHPALALLETMAHLELSLDDIPTTLRLSRIHIDPALQIARPDLPDGWQAHPSMTRRIGDAWLDSAQTAVLAVPSAVSPWSTNYLINPLHPDVASGIVEHGHEAVWIDPRYLR